MQPESVVDSPQSNERRVLLQQIGVLLGAATLPCSALQAAAEPAARRFLDAARFQLLRAVSDTMVPRTDTAGALQAGIPQLIDTLLRNWASAATRTQLGDALQRIDATAIAQSGRRFAQLRPDARLSLLRSYDAAALQPAPQTGAPLSVDAMLAGPPVRDADYARLKELVVTLYYSSKVGLTQELTYVHAPGKWQPSVPVTKDTRPAGGGGLF